MLEDNDQPPSPSGTAPPPPPLPPLPPPRKSLPRPLELRLPLANAARSADVLSPLEPCFPEGKSAAAAAAANEEAAAAADLDQNRTEPSRPPDTQADGG